MSVTAWVGALLAAAVLAASPAAAAKAAAVNIGIAPSPNGLVMKGEPTQIAVSGVPSATILIWNAEQKKWFRIGKATRAQAAAYTFTQSGIQRIKATPSKGKSRVFSVAVYAKYPMGTNTPTTYGPIILPSVRSFGSFRDDTESFTAQAANGCALVDIGLKLTPYAATNAVASVSVQSTGANPASYTATVGAPVGVTGIPVKGDVVIQAEMVTGGTGVRGQAEIGVVWTCL
jgi:hypothetical protein